MNTKKRKLFYPELEATIRKSGYTYSSFGKLIDMSADELSKRMLGKVAFKLEEAIDITLSLGSTMDELFISEERRRKA